MGECKGFICGIKKGGVRNQRDKVRDQKGGWVERTYMLCQRDGVGDQKARSDMCG